MAIQRSSITINYHETASNSITDLTGTKWVFNTFSFATYEPSGFSVNGNFLGTSFDDTTFSGIKVKLGDLQFYCDPMMSGSDSYKNIANFTNPPLTIEITGGTDVDNPTLIAWLEANAEQQVEPEPEPTPEPTSEKLITLDNLAVFKEEEDTLLSQKMANPMTAAGDIVVGGASGTPARLAKGTAGQVLTMNSGATAPEWQTPSGGTTLYRHTFDMTWAESGRTSYKKIVIICNRPTTLMYSGYSLSHYLVFNCDEIIAMYILYGDSLMPLSAIFSNTRTESLMYTLSVYNGSWVTFAYNSSGFKGTNEVIEKL